MKQDREPFRRWLAWVFIALLVLFAPACTTGAPPDTVTYSVEAGQTNGDGVASFPVAGVEVESLDLVTGQPVVGANVELFSNGTHLIAGIHSVSGDFDLVLLEGDGLGTGVSGSRLNPVPSTPSSIQSSDVITRFVVHLAGRAIQGEAPSIEELPHEFMVWFLNQYTTCRRTTLNGAFSILLEGAAQNATEQVVLYSIAVALSPAAPAAGTLVAATIVKGVADTLAGVVNGAQITYYGLGYAPTDPFDICTLRAASFPYSPLPNFWVMKPVTTAEAPAAAESGISGRAVDAVTRTGLASADVMLVGPTLVQTRTDSEGYFGVESIPSGSYAVTVVTPGYVPSSVEVTLPPLSTTYREIALSRGLVVGEVRIVLTWGAEPRDLDSHLLTPSIEGRVYEVAYYSRGSLSVAPFAALDVDDTSSYGPETITISRRFPGAYSYAVRNFSDGGSSTSSRLYDLSAAMVEVVADGRLVARFRVRDVVNPGPGTWWHVFDMDGNTGQITPVNLLSFSRPFARPSTADSVSSATPTNDATEGVLKESRLSR